MWVGWREDFPLHRDRIPGRELGVGRIREPSLVQRRARLQVVKRVVPRVLKFSRVAIKRFVQLSADAGAAFCIDQIFEGVIMNTADFSIHYRSTVRGFTASERGNLTTVYYGITQRIPKDVFESDPFNASGQSCSEMVDAVGRIPNRISNCTIERYEARDMENGDLIVIVRVPCGP